MLRKLGEGGMGAVYVGEHALLGRKAAIKVLLPSLSSHEEIVQRFFNEARAVTQIADPGIVQVFDFGHTAEGNAYIVMELLEGEPMDKRLERIGRFSPIDCLRLMRLICTSLYSAHQKGIVHRDLKPENIFIVGDPAVTGGERAKILDFGIAKLTADEPGKMKTRTGMVMGTPVYMSPEQCRGAGEVDARSDIYSIACVMMTMLTGRPPFDGEGSGELIAAHLREPPPLAASRVPGLPELFDQILQRCLAKNPKDRFGSMAELAQTLGHAEQMVIYSSGTPAVAATPDYRASGLTPPPGMRMPTPAPHMRAPTGPPGVGSAVLPTGTLTNASGESAPDDAAPPKKRFAIVLAAVGAAVVAAIVFVAMQSGKSNETKAAGSGSDVTEPVATPTTPPPPAVTPDAAIAVVPVDAAQVVAETPDAAAVTPPPESVDAGVTVTSKRPKHGDKDPKKGGKKPPNTSGGSNAQPAAGSARPIDRGD